jgi:hypothetical protein
MKESYSEDLASHADPESCVVVCEDGCEAFVRGMCRQSEVWLVPECTRWRMMGENKRLAGEDPDEAPISGGAEGHACQKALGGAPLESFGCAKIEASDPSSAFGAGLCVHAGPIPNGSPPPSPSPRRLWVSGEFFFQNRGLWPSCNAKHMAQTAVHLVAYVLPFVPFRQVVLTQSRGGCSRPMKLFTFSHTAIHVPTRLG